MVSVDLEIQVDGELELGQLNRAMTIFGELVINKIKENIRKMDLISKTGAGGAFLQGWLAKWNGKSLIIENTQKYALYLEYGTYGYASKFGEDSFPDTPDPKKQDMPKELRQAFPKGMQPFAPVRRVLFNDAIVQELLQIAFSSI